MRLIGLIVALVLTVAFLLNGAEHGPARIPEAIAAVDHVAAAIDAPTISPGTRWTSARALAIRTAPSLRAPVRAHLGANEPFEVFDIASDSSCPDGGWGRTEGGGFVCLNAAQATPEAPVRLPRLVRFVHPDPTEWEQYIRTMRYDTDPADGIDAMVPFIYAKRWRGWRAPQYASLGAFERGMNPVRRMGAGRKYHFVESAAVERGTVLLRDNGRAVPADQVHIYPLTKFQGWDVHKEPVPPGHLPAWAIDYEGTRVHTAPNHSAPVGQVIDYHTALLIEDEPVDRSGHWWVMPNALGPSIPGFVHDGTGIRHWSPAPPLAGLAAGELWIDVDLAQQVLALRRGSDVLYITLVSTGEPGTATPRGIFRIQDKSATGDMSSRPGSDEPYYVEKVPWVMHFKNRYALHGTFWHWGFGHTASHGCINLSVRDARHIFDRVSPTAYGGWQTTLSSYADPGTTIRIRRGTAPVLDRRKG